MKVAIVAPCHIQPSPSWEMALGGAMREARRDNKYSLDIIIVDDSDGGVEYPNYFGVYDYKRQEGCMGKELYSRFEQFHYSSACKQFGLWRAYQLGYDVVIVIDSDCNIYEGFVQGHLRALEGKGQGWENPLKSTGLFSRGFPYSKRNLPIGAHMGLWDNEWDLYGADRVAEEHEGRPFTRKNMLDMDIHTPAGIFPLSGMNVSFKREVIPYMLFLPNFKNDQGESFTRHDDIWGGYIFQKILHEKGYALSYGNPYVFHDTVVVAEQDARAEIPMIKYEDDFLTIIDFLIANIPFRNGSGGEIFGHLAENFECYGLEGLTSAFNFQAHAYE